MDLGGNNWRSGRLTKSMRRTKRFCEGVGNKEIFRCAFSLTKRKVKRFCYGEQWEVVKEPP